MGDGLVFPDKNIVIDAAEAVLDAWYAFMAPEETFADPARAAAALQRLEMAGLSGQVADGTLDPAQARVQACGALLEAALSGSPSSAGSPAPPWLLGAMTESHDPRVRDLGSSMRSASVVMTTEVIAYAQYRLEAKGVPKGAATSLVLAMTRGQRVVDVGVGQAAVGGVRTGRASAPLPA